MKKSHHTRLLSLILAFSLSVSLCVPAFAAGTFSDVPASHWAYSDIMECANLGIVTGFADGTFRPNDTVTQVEFVVMFSRVVDAQEGIENVAAELGGNVPWYLPTMTWASRFETLYSTSFADPNTWAAATVTPITRADMAVIAYDACFYGDNNAAGWNAALAALADEDQIAEKYRLFIGGCMTVNCLTGYPDGTFRPDAVMTRAEACVVAGRMRRIWKGEDLTKPAAPVQTQQPNTTTNTTTDTTSSNGTLANGQPATPENVTAMLDQIKTKYPDGTTWGEQVGLYKTPSRAVVDAFTSIKCAASATSGCGGFAAMVSDTIFGTNTGTEVTNMADVRPGDILVIYKSNGTASHVAIVLSVLAPGATGNANKDRWLVHTADGNIGTPGKVSWSMSYGVMGIGSSNPVPGTGQYYRFITRY